MSSDAADVTEHSRALIAELVLTNDLSAEVAARVAAVQSEQVQRVSEDGVLTAAINSEAGDRAAGDLNLQNQYDQLRLDHDDLLARFNALVASL